MAIKFACVKSALNSPCRMAPSGTCSISQLRTGAATCVDTRRTSACIWVLSDVSPKATWGPSTQSTAAEPVKFTSGPTSSNCSIANFFWMGERCNLSEERSSVSGDCPARSGPTLLGFARRKEPIQESPSAGAASGGSETLVAGGANAPSMVISSPPVLIFIGEIMNCRFFRSHCAAPEIDWIMTGSKSGSSRRK